MRIKSIASLGILLLFLVPSGCRQNKVPNGFPKLQPVTLELHQEEKPLAEATVSLYPIDETNKWSSGGFSDQAGRAMMVTHGGHDGVPVGKYKVTVLKTVVEGEEATMDSVGSTKSFSLIEKIFTSRKTTPLEIEVKDGNNSFRLDIGKAIKIPLK